MDQNWKGNRKSFLKIDMKNTIKNQNVILINQKKIRYPSKDCKQSEYRSRKGLFEELVLFIACGFNP